MSLSRPKPKSHNLKPANGFTLIETLVAIFILGLGLTAASALLNQNIASARLVRDNYIASGLVQEGIEVVRNMRDNEWHQDAAFGVIVQDGTWSVEWNSTALGSNYNTFLKKDAGGFYNYSSGIDTVFKRQVVVSTVAAGIEKKVVATVNWTVNGQPKTLSAEAHLFNWGP